MALVAEGPGFLAHGLENNNLIAAPIFSLLSCTLITVFSMQVLIFAVFTALLGVATAATCSGDVDAAELPYSTKWTTTGDSNSTTFVMTVRI